MINRNGRKNFTFILFLISIPGLMDFYGGSFQINTRLIPFVDVFIATVILD